jgi:hypothetical protein
MGCITSRQQNAHMPHARLVFRIHAVQRMFEREIGEDDVRVVLRAGERIQDYPNDAPYPSYLMLGRVGIRPLHVVAADHDEDRETIVITVYEPDPERWDAELRRRSKP